MLCLSVVIASLISADWPNLSVIQHCVKYLQLDDTNTSFLGIALRFGQTTKFSGVVLDGPNK